MTLRRAFALIGLFTVLVFALRLALNFGTNPEQPYGSSLFFWGAWLISTSVAVIGIVWFGSIRSALGTWRALGWHPDALLPRLALGLVVGVIAVSITIAGSLIAGGTVNEALDTFASYSLSQRAVFIAIGLQAAFVEESLFRGTLQPLLVARLGKFGGLVVTAAVFSAYHLDPRPLSLASKFALGLVYGLARGTDPRGSLVASGLGHLLVWTTVGSF